LFARTWAERLAEELPLAIATSRQLVRDSRDADRLEDWSPTEDDLERSFRQMWAANATVVWTGYQAQRWLARLAREIDEPVPLEIEPLKVLRNALEHLDTALFDEDGVATADPTDKGAWSLRALGALPVQSWAPDGPLFALVDVGALQRLSGEILGRLGALMDAIAEDYFVQQEIDRRLGK
jgi:hypothetical protein